MNIKVERVMIAIFLGFIMFLIKFFSLIPGTDGQFDYWTFRFASFVIFLFLGLYVLKGKKIFLWMTSILIFAFAVYVTNSFPETSASSICDYVDYDGNVYSCDCNGVTKETGHRETICLGEREKCYVHTYIDDIYMMIHVLDEKKEVECK